MLELAVLLLRCILPAWLIEPIFAIVCPGLALLEHLTATRKLSAMYIIRIPHFIQHPFLKGPTSPALVKRHGYTCTADRAEAWPFESRKKAEAKTKILDRHFGDPSLSFEVIEVASAPAAGDAAATSTL